jgi:hypothetical protein
MSSGFEVSSTLTLTVISAFGSAGLESHPTITKVETRKRATWYFMDKALVEPIRRRGKAWRGGGYGSQACSWEGMLRTFSA